MLNGFYILHKKHPRGDEQIPGISEIPLFGFKTCLRHIYFAHDASESLNFADIEFEIYRNEEAYSFIFEVLCGLHSPVIGETEVFGQFKNQIKLFKQNTQLPYALSKIFNSLIVDVKMVRGQHLLDLGGQSYGSLIRKQLSSPAHVALIGAGGFARDILPWIYKDQNRVEVYARNAEKAKSELKAFPLIDVKSLADNKITAEAVIIAAPLSAKEIEALVVSKDALVIDLRGESREDGCGGFANYKDLNSFFEKIQANQTQILNAKAQALALIGEITLKRFSSENPRPFGWEDICVW